MPKSKRSKKVSLTKIKKKDLNEKQNFIDEIKECVNTYKRIFVFSFDNVKNNFIKEIRLAWRDNSRLFFCKNRIMAVALGRTPGEEIQQDLHLLSSKLMGNRGLFFTNAKRKEVLKYFESYRRQEYPHAGNIATETFEVPEGPLEQFAHSLEPHLRKLGLPTELRKGVPTMMKSHVVCKEGDVLSPDQARLLKLFKRKTAEFRLTMEFMWSKNKKSFTDFGKTDDVLFITKPKKNPKDRKKNTQDKLNSTENANENGDTNSQNTQDILSSTENANENGDMDSQNTKDILNSTENANENGDMNSQSDSDSEMSVSEEKDNDQEKRELG